MQSARQQFGDLIRIQREHKKLSQEGLAKALDGVNRSNVAHLEQGLRMPKGDLLERICIHLDLPKPLWERFTGPEVHDRLDFEEQLAEMSGTNISLDGHDSSAETTAERVRKFLFETRRGHSSSQAHDLFNSLLVFYGVRPTTKAFFQHYFGPESFASISKFRDAVKAYQRDAVRLYSTLDAAYRGLNDDQLAEKLGAISVRNVDDYSARASWELPNDLPDERLPYLGYISAARVKEEKTEREQLQRFLLDLAEKFRGESPASVIAAIPERTKRRMDALLRKFDTNLEHGLFSSLWAPTSDVIEREAHRLNPTSTEELDVMEDTQKKAMENLAFYLSSDYLDIYVATSMRTDADFVSVNAFSKALFVHPDVSTLNLRYFNPTQSWIDDRIAKGLVEALMLRRASITIYMAQKSDTFGKDSEASVALGQGKPVIVYVPRLTFPGGVLDTESLFLKSRQDLMLMLTPQEKTEVDELVDEQGLFAKILSKKLQELDPHAFAQLAQSHWADFDLYEEVRRVPEAVQQSYRVWLQKAIHTGASEGEFEMLREHLVGMFVANAITFERRAKLFREIHPLALQVILSSGVLNGILVVRTVEQCATILSCLIRNDLQLELKTDEKNYRLVEKLTDSTIRVISRHRLLQQAFFTHMPRYD